MKALILAAGYSTRLYPLTLNTPKALLPIGKKCMIDYLAEQLHTVEDLSEVVIVTNARFYEDFCQWVLGAQARYAPLSFRVINDETMTADDRRGAVGDIQYAIEQAHLDDDLLVAASDNFFTFPLNDFIDDFKRSGCDTLLAHQMDSLEDLRRFAVATLDEHQHVIDLVEKPTDPPTDIAIYALYLYRRDTLPLVKQYLDEGGAPDAPGHFPEWLYKRKPVRVYIFKGECIDVGTPDSYHEVCRRFGKK